MRRLKAYVNIDRVNPEMGPVLVVTGEIGSYFSSQGYTNQFKDNPLSIGGES